MPVHRKKHLWGQLSLFRDCVEVTIVQEAVNVVVLIDRGVPVVVLRVIDVCC